ncbi:TPA: ead/Ea22-like family protein [Pseudomonas aeruginosa]
MDEPLFNELLESVKQADQIMTDHAELRRLAGLASCGNWYGEDSQVLVDKHAIAYCNHKVDAQFIGEANPNTILALLDEIDRLKAESDRLRQGMKGDYDIDAWLDWSKEKEQIKAQNDALQGALHAVQAEVDGNLRPLTRDLVNMVSGLNNGCHPNDIYEHCDEIERIIGAALEGAKP